MYKLYMRCSIIKNCFLSPPSPPSIPLLLGQPPTPQTSLTNSSLHPHLQQSIHQNREVPLPKDTHSFLKLLPRLRTALAI